MSSTTTSPHARRPRLMIIGGFLGAGKTTTILAIARLLQERGESFGIVTNDQGSDLVDTHYLRANGLVVDEVTGGCFCCNFDQFAAALARYEGEASVVLAEPVGSCTDLVATLFRPLRAHETERFDLAPLAVVVDPRRARRYLASRGSPEINFLFEKQADEADLLLLNKVDTLDAREAQELRAQLQERFPGRPVLGISARTGAGMDELLAATGTISHRDAPLEISYDRYGESEAALGWLNLRGLVEHAAGLDLNAVTTAILSEIGRASRERDWDIAHAKVYLVGGLDYAKASLTDAESEPVLDEQMNSRPQTVEIVLNARVAAPPEALQRTAEAAIRSAVTGGSDTAAGGEGKAGQGTGTTGTPDVSIQTARAFRPSYPTPTHRIEA